MMLCMLNAVSEKQDIGETRYRRGDKLVNQLFHVSETGFSLFLFALEVSRVGYVYMYVYIYPATEGFRKEPCIESCVCTNMNIYIEGAAKGQSVRK